MAYGVTDTGWNGKPLATIQDEVDEDLRGILGDSAGTEEDGSIPLESAAGQLKSMFVDPIAALWDLGEVIYSSRDPNQATGASQNSVNAIRGSVRSAEAYSTAVLTCVGTALTQLLAGRQVRVEGTGAIFISDAAGTITAVSAWVALTLYAVGDRVKNSGNVYQCITAGTSAGAGGPTTTSADITDGTVHWKYLGAGTGAVDVDYTAQEVGAVGGLAGTINDIATPVNGWNAVLNLLDAEVGRDQETDARFRARSDAELAAAGNSTVDTIRANILRVNQGSVDPDHEPPLACVVFFNDTDAQDSEGLPPHSVEVLVQEGTTADIAQAIWDSVGAGTRTYGTRSDSVVDSEGNTQTVHWTRPTEVPIYVTSSGYYDPVVWTSTAAEMVQAMLSAMLTYTATYPIARDVYSTALGAAILRGPSETDDDATAVVPASDGSPIIQGLLEVNPVYIGTSASPVSGVTLPITRRQIAVFDSSRCVFTAYPETP